jgi:hypothetical protein
MSSLKQGGETSISDANGDNRRKENTKHWTEAGKQEAEQEEERQDVNHNN